MFQITKSIKMKCLLAQKGVPLIIWRQNYSPMEEFIVFKVIYGH